MLGDDYLPIDEIGDFLKEGLLSLRSADGLMAPGAVSFKIGGPDWKDMPHVDEYVNIPWVFPSDFQFLPEEVLLEYPA